MSCTVIVSVTMLLLSALFSCLTHCACIWACDPEEPQLLCRSLSQSLLLPYRLRIQAQQRKQKLTAKSQKKFDKRLYGSTGGTATSGLSSSLAFTPVQVSNNLSCCLCSFMVVKDSKQHRCFKHQQVTHNSYSSDYSFAKNVFYHLRLQAIH